MTPDAREAKTIWSNGAVPVVLRRGGSQPIRLRLRFAKDNRSWLKKDARKKEPYWEKNGKYWELPASRFDEIVSMLLVRFGRVYIIQPYREKEVCAPACMNATGFECRCSCLGVNHGIGISHGWFEVSEAFAVRYGATKLACRLLIKSATSDAAKRE